MVWFRCDWLKERGSQETLSTYYPDSAVSYVMRDGSSVSIRVGDENISVSEICFSNAEFSKRLRKQLEEANKDEDTD